MLKNRLRKEHLRLIAECRQMAGQAQRLSTAHGEVFADTDSVLRAESLNEVIEELDVYEQYLDRNDYLPPGVAQSYIRLHGVLASEVSGINTGKKAFQKRFENNEPTSNNANKLKAYTAKEKKELLLKTCVIVTFALCMYFFFYSKL